MPKPIYVTRPILPPIEEYEAELRSIWDSAYLTNFGEKHHQLATALGAYLEVPALTLFANGHMALESAINALDLTGEVITTPFTFASTTQAIVRSGLTPVFCDIREDNCTMDASRIEALITEKTSAILPVHVYGNICDVEAIDWIAKKYHLKIIYDAAHAFGEKLNGVGVGCFGDISMFSLHATKCFHTVEGGLLTFKDTGLLPKLDAVRNFGIHHNTPNSEEEVPRVGGNAKMSEFHAAMGLCNLRHVEEHHLERKAVFEQYTQRLADVPGLGLPEIQPGVAPNYSYYPLRIDGGTFGKSRDAVYEKMRQCGIYVRKYFYPITSSFDAYTGMFPIQKTPIAERISASVLTLPLYAGLSSKDVDRICDVLLKKD